MHYIKNHKVALLFAAIVIFTSIRIVSAFYSGYSGFPFDVFSILFTEPIRYLLIIICAIVLIRTALARKALAFAGLVLLLIIGLIPTGHYLTLGALLSIQSANPEQFRNEARSLLEEYGGNTKFSDYPPRVLNEYVQFPRSQLPFSILRANIEEVFVFEKYVFIAKFGLGGSFRGFIVFREGDDMWKVEQPITRLEDCSYCWRIRIIDGLYWYHAAPVDEEDAVLDFLAKYCIIAQGCPTMRAPEWWESPRFQAVCVASSWFRQNGVLSSRPPAGNASR